QRLRPGRMLPQEPVAQMALAFQVLSGQVDEPGGFVDVVAAHGRCFKPKAFHPRQQLVAGILDPAAGAVAPAAVVVVHNFEATLEAAGEISLADGGAREASGLRRWQTRIRAPR